MLFPNKTTFVIFSSIIWWNEYKSRTNICKWEIVVPKRMLESKRSRVTEYHSTGYRPTPFSALGILSIHHHIAIDWRKKRSNINQPATTIYNFNQSQSLQSIGTHTSNPTFIRHNIRLQGFPDGTLSGKKKYQVHSFKDHTKWITHETHVLGWLWTILGELFVWVYVTALFFLLSREKPRFPPNSQV